jgi:ketosteroid isomerase-like protein
MRRQHRQRVSHQFHQLVQGRLSEFLSGCTEDLVLIVRGSHPVPVTLQRSDIADWYGSLQALSPGSLRSSVEVAQADEKSAMVILRHHFARNGVSYRVELANLLTLRDGLLATWSSYPLDLAEYARAWQATELVLAAPAQSIT